MTAWFTQTAEPGPEHRWPAPPERQSVRGQQREPERPNGPAHLRELAKGRPLTLLTATRQPEISEAAVLAELLRG